MSLPRPLAIALWPLSLAYGAGARFRTRMYAKGWLAQKTLSRPVISVGNLTVGGTGKTPMVIWLAERFLNEGKRVGILSRGYHGEDGTSDEVDLMKGRLGDRVLFGVGKDRYAEGRKLEAQGAELFLLDDGFQHLRLARDVDIVLIDRLQPLSEDKLLPAGRLREPLVAVNRADLVVYTRTDRSELTVRLIQSLKQFPIFPASTALRGFKRVGSDEPLLSASEVGDGPYFAFCGIGNPDAFFLDLKTWGLAIAGERAFADHHKYSSAEIRELQSSARAAGAVGLVTTEKDFYNLRKAGLWTMPVYFAVISLEMRDEKLFSAAITQKLTQRHCVGT